MFASRNVEKTVNERKLEGIARNGVLSMYREQPEGELSLEEFERLAIDRIQGNHHSNPISCTHI